MPLVPVRFGLFSAENQHAKFAVITMYSEPDNATSGKRRLSIRRKTFNEHLLALIPPRHSLPRLTIFFVCLIFRFALIGCGSASENKLFAQRRAREH